MADMTMGQRIAAERKKLGISQEMLGENRLSRPGFLILAVAKWGNIRYNVALSVG